VFLLLRFNESFNYWQLSQSGFSIEQALGPVDDATCGAAEDVAEPALILDFSTPVAAFVRR
jgi:hypothetical protein